MTLNAKMRKIWHDFYYRISGQPGAHFALRCRQVAEAVDLKGSERSLIEKFQIALHISLCQACHNYSEFSVGLQKKVQEIHHHRAPTSDEINKINQRLINKISK